MDVFYIYTYGTAAWLGIQTVPLMVSPKLIVNLLAADARTPTALEEYYCRSLAFSLLAISVLTVLLSGTIPLSSSLSESEITLDPSDPKAPYAVPTMMVTSIFHTINTIYAHLRYMRTGQTCFALSEIGSGGLAAVGFWCLMFGTEQGRISKRTGADKRTSGWPFKNVESDKKKSRKRT